MQNMRRNGSHSFGFITVASHPRPFLNSVRLGAVAVTSKKSNVHIEVCLMNWRLAISESCCALPRSVFSSACAPGSEASRQAHNTRMGLHITDQGHVDVVDGRELDKRHVATRPHRPKRERSTN